MRHARRRIVITGGPGAGKTAVLELLRRALCTHAVVLPEAAGIVFGGGFPRRTDVVGRCAAQRAIFHVQRALEDMVESDDLAIALCDRGLVDGAAYWTGAGDFWTAVGMSREDALARYDLVIHLRVPEAHDGYGHQNPLRVESAAEARAIDDRILQVWHGHPRRRIIEANTNFMVKANAALEIVGHEVPSCCVGHRSPADTEGLHPERAPRPEQVLMRSPA
jgi:predicted ATPase